MKPDAYMPFYFRAFFEAVRGWPAVAKVAYLQAITYDWGHEHCAGLKDDSEFLRGVCGVDKDEWEMVMALAFDNDKFFVLGEDGKWHQKRAAEEYKKAEAAYDKVVKGGKNRWAGVSKSEHSRITRLGAKVRWNK
jgi:uncharacterized protein YdaU (DUF1376 family)